MRGRSVGWDMVERKINFLTFSSLFAPGVRRMRVPGSSYCHAAERLAKKSLEQHYGISGCADASLMCALDRKGKRRASVRYVPRFYVFVTKACRCGGLVRFGPNDFGATSLTSLYLPLVLEVPVNLRPTEECLQMYTATDWASGATIIGFGTKKF